MAPEADAVDWLDPDAGEDVVASFLVFASFSFAQRRDVAEFAPDIGIAQLRRWIVGHHPVGRALDRRVRPRLPTATVGFSVGCGLGFGATVGSFGADSFESCDPLAERVAKGVYVPVVDVPAPELCGEGGGDVARRGRRRYRRVVDRRHSVGRAAVAGRGVFGDRSFGLDSLFGVRDLDLDLGLGDQAIERFGVGRTDAVDGDVLLAGLEIALEHDGVPHDLPAIDPVVGVKPDVVPEDVLGDDVEHPDGRSRGARRADLEDDRRHWKLIGIRRLRDGHPVSPRRYLPTSGSVRRIG